MKRTTNSRTRFSLALTILIVATLGLTSCDGEADHYFAIFGPLTSGNANPGCLTFCAATASVPAADGSFKADRGDEVRFVNFTKSTVEVTLKYRQEGQITETQDFTLSAGKSKKKRIPRDLPPSPDTTIEVSYSVDGVSPPLGGPKMIVDP